MRLSQWVLPFLVGATALGSTIAMGADESLQSTLPSEVKTESRPEMFIADGQAFEIKEMGIKITPPTGWEVRPKDAGVTLLMQEKRVTPEAAKAATYQKNITLAVMHRPSPIDEARAKELNEELTKTYGQSAIVSDYKILEHKFFNHRSQNDGLVMYSSMKLDGFDMMQMHVLLSSADRQFLMTYTDFASEFQKQTSGFTAAWNSMVSLDVQGSAPKRYEALIKNSVVAGALLLSLSILGFMRSRRARMDYETEADKIYEDEQWVENDRSLPQTMSAVWNLSALRKREELFEDDGFEFSQVQHFS